MHEALNDRFDEIHNDFGAYLARFESTSYLSRGRDEVDGVREERELIARGAIRACGWRWVGRSPRGQR
jgi:hypothetical protein